MITENADEHAQICADREFTAEETDFFVQRICVEVEFVNERKALVDYFVQNHEKRRNQEQRMSRRRDVGLVEVQNLVNRRFHGVGIF